MSNNLDRDLSIIAQVAAKAATELSVAEIGAGQQFDSDAWKSRTKAIFNFIIQTAGGVAAPVQDVTVAVANVFPEAQVVAAPAPAPAPVTGGGFLASIGARPHQLSTTGDEKVNLHAHVADLDANPGDYYDNRANKKNPKGPDFKHKRTGVALWLRTEG
jgi:hypothetical protein